MNRFLILPFLSLLAAPAFAESELMQILTATDVGRLADYQTARDAAIRTSRENGAPEDVETLEGILAGDLQPIRGLDIRGDYRCRVAKLGGIGDLVIYNWFRCRIGEDDIGYRLEKLTGSQRVTGHFIDDSETGLIFYGADHYDYEEPGKYNDNPERNAVGRLVKVGDERFRLEFPKPFLESEFDILELEKR